MSLHNFHRTMSPALVVPLMVMDSTNRSSGQDSPFGDFGSAMRSIFDPFDLFGAAKNLSHEIILAPVDIVHEVGTAFTAGVTAVGSTVTGVAGSLENTAASLLFSPMVMIGGAAVLLILLSK